MRAELLRLNSVSTQSKSSCKDNILTVMEDITKVSQIVLKIWVSQLGLSRVTSDIR